MNRETFRTHRREIKARCFANTIDALVRHGQIAASADELAETVAGFSDETWQLITAIANGSHDCGVEHEVPSNLAQTEVVNLFTSRALQSERVSDLINAEIRRAAGRIGRHLSVMQ